MSATHVALALCASLTVWFALASLREYLTERAKSEVQRRHERVTRENEKLRRGGPRARLAAKAVQLGWVGPIEPLVFGFVLVYLASAVALSILGLTSVLAALIALPASFAVTMMVSTVWRNRRQRLFQEQLVAAFDQFAAQLRQGSSPPRAIEDLAPTLPEPLRSEMNNVIDQHRSARSLSDAVADLAVRYPSRAMNLFVAALRASDTRGAKLAPALEQAAETLRKDFELSAEAEAEVAQEKMQFIGIVGVLSVIAVTTFTQASEETQSAFLSPVGLVVLALAVANFVFGVIRVLRILAKVKGDI